MKSILIILRPVDSLIKNRILGWNFFFFQILKVQLDHLTSRAAAQREVRVTLILNSMCVTFSLEKTDRLLLVPSVLKHHSAAPWSRFIFT